jgi:hypothetical protein
VLAHVVSVDQPKCQPPVTVGGRVEAVHEYDTGSIVCDFRVYAYDRRQACGVCPMVCVNGVA